MSMLEVCRERAELAGISARCQFVHGYIQDLPSDQNNFDAVISLLAAHFVPRESRLPFYEGMTRRLRRQGFFINAEISADLESAQFPTMLQAWEELQKLMGATPESLATLPQQLRNVLTILPPTETEKLIRQGGVSSPIPFFQALMIRGWYGTKEA